MTLAIIIAISAAIALSIILKLAVSRRAQLSMVPNLAQQIQPIDVEAFRNLIDPAEDEYLRRRLTAGQLRVVRRARLRATAAYVQMASNNAVVLLRVAQGALLSENPRTAEAAQQLINEALLLRRNTAFALARIYVAVAWPGYGAAGSAVAERYDRLSRSATLLGRLQNPGTAVRISGVR